MTLLRGCYFTCHKGAIKMSWLYLDLHQVLCWLSLFTLSGLDKAGVWVKPLRGVVVVVLTQCLIDSVTSESCVCVCVGHCARSLKDLSDIHISEYFLIVFMRFCLLTNFWAQSHVQLQCCLCLCVSLNVSFSSVHTHPNSNCVCCEMLIICIVWRQTRSTRRQFNITILWISPQSKWACMEARRSWEQFRDTQHANLC